MEMPTPTTEHQKLEIIAGRWEGEETMYPSPWDPNGGKAIGRSNSRIALGGFALISDYEQERDGRISFTGHGVFTYSSKEKLYTLTWFDCMGVQPEVFKGNFNGEILRISHGGPGMHAQLTYDLSEPNYLVMSMELAQDGVNWTKLFDARLVRQ